MQDGDFAECDTSSPDKGLGLDFVAQGHRASNLGRLGEWAAGVWLMSRGYSVSFGAPQSKHDLIAENLETNEVKSVQVKTTQGDRERARYKWELKARKSQRDAGRGRWDAAKSQRLILVAVNANQGSIWILDSDVHYLGAWQDQIVLTYPKCDLEAEAPFLILEPSAFDRLLGALPEHTTEPSLFDLP
jgi:hypothetical protein